MGSVRVFKPAGTHGKLMTTVSGPKTMNAGQYVQQGGPGTQYFKKPRGPALSLVLSSQTKRSGSMMRVVGRTGDEDVFDDNGAVSTNWENTAIPPPTKGNDDPQPPIVPAVLPEVDNTNPSFDNFFTNTQTPHVNEDASMPTRQIETRSRAGRKQKTNLKREATDDDIEIRKNELGEIRKSRFKYNNVMMTEVAPIFEKAVEIKDVDMSDAPNVAYIPPILPEKIEGLLVAANKRLATFKKWIINDLVPPSNAVNEITQSSHYTASKNAVMNVDAEAFNNNAKRILKSIKGKHESVNLDNVKATVIKGLDLKVVAVKRQHEDSLKRTKINKKMKLSHPESEGLKQLQIDNGPIIEDVSDDPKYNQLLIKHGVPKQLMIEYNKKSSKKKHQSEVEKLLIAAGPDFPFRTSRSGKRRNSLPKK